MNMVIRMNEDGMNGELATTSTFAARDARNGIAASTWELSSNRP